jgi:hypothetical protein
MARPNSKRALRRHHLQRRRIRAFRKLLNWDSYSLKSQVWLNSIRLHSKEEYMEWEWQQALRTAETMKRCSCHLCRGKKSRDAKTRQEIVLTLKEKEDMMEL